MKHPHASIISQLLEDTTQEIEIYSSINNNIDDDINWVSCFYQTLLLDGKGKYKFRIKPKQDQYEHLRQAIRDGKKIEQFVDGCWVNYWYSVDNNVFTLPARLYRIHDPYLELKETKEQVL